MSDKRMLRSWLSTERLWDNLFCLGDGARHWLRALWPASTRRPSRALSHFLKYLPFSLLTDRCAKNVKLFCL